MGRPPAVTALSPGAGRHPLDRLRPSLSLQDAVFLVVASVVGSGIFLTPGTIADRLPHPGLIFVAWTAGGLLSLVGALANAELGAMYPRAGGNYVYLREAFHPAAGFGVGWFSFFAIYAGTVAALALGFGLGVVEGLGWSEGAGIALAVVVILASSALNWVGVRWGAAANNLTGWVKVLALLLFVAVAPFTGRGSAGNLEPLARGLFQSAGWAAFALAMSPVLFSYLGWNASVFVASEIREPGRNVPRSLFLGLAICTALYLVMNAVYLYALPVEALRLTTNTGEAAAGVLFGEAGGAWVTAFVLASILGTLNATVLVGPRIAYAMGLDGLFPASLGRAHADYATPTAAIALQAGTAIALVVLLRSFPSALDFTTFAIVLATIADTLALYALRRRRPELTRPYRAWGYPWLPALYLVANAAIALGLLLERPLEAGVAVAVLASGIPVYLGFARRRPGWAGNS